MFTNVSNPPGRADQISQPSIAYSAISIDSTVGEFGQLDGDFLDAAEIDQVHPGGEVLVPVEEAPIFPTCESGMNSGDKLARSLRISPDYHKVITRNLRENLGDTRYQAGRDSSHPSKSSKNFPNFQFATVNMPEI